MRQAGADDRDENLGLVHVRGRSRRVTFNHRTTAQNLHYAVGVLEGSDFVDLDAQEETAEGYRSARSGPAPQVLPFDSLVAQYDGLAEMLSGWLGRRSGAGDSRGAGA